MERDPDGERLTLAVLGASGRTGRLLVEEAIAAGHEVRAFVRDRSRLPLEHDRLTVIEGDAYADENVGRAVEGADAVLSALGRGEDSPEDLLTMAGEHIVGAMEAHDVERFVTLVGAGVRHEDDDVSLGGRLVVGAMKVIARETLTDARSHVAAVRASDLEWTVVRPPRLVDGDHTGEYRTGALTLGPRERISRADLAEFMLDCVEDERYVRELPMVSY
jgi:putative NADH-flavin reductase